MFRRVSRFLSYILIPAVLLAGGLCPAQQADEPTEAVVEKSLDDKINDAVSPYTDAISTVVFVPVWKGQVGPEGEKVDLEVPFVLLWLAAAAFFLTFFFKFINLRGFALALRTVKGKYSKSDDPGEITHFQALTAAVSGTVGLGNIAGVAIAISMGGPGAAFWMVVMGLCGMSSKFAECTLGVKYRQIDKDGKVHGGAMHYLTRGFAARGMGPLGKTLAVFFGICCIGASFGGGNMYQINQATSQLVNVTGGAESFFADKQWLFGLAVAILVGAAIIGGIARIGKITASLVPTMTVIYIIGCFIVLGSHLDKIVPTFGLIFTSAFSGEALAGGFVGTLLQGIRRAAFSNEAGIGSAPIAHAAVKTRYAASEGLVALLEPFVDTVIICTMTALVVLVTGDYMHRGDDGITITSDSFASVVPWFSYVLSVAVILFALSTLISWSYYGLQAWKFLFGKSKASDMTFKLIFCFVIILGAAMSPGKVIDFSDAMLFSMSFANLLGVYLLLPVIKRELKKFVLFTKRVDAGESIEMADAHVKSQLPDLEGRA
ncbi:MAG: alanine:cation symporter family protein [Akkermansiaceae bacterium]|jgi:alanine or glycine:cation symporter, AGCS family|nr:alanine:cation symporter family protein [Akkermansiaceae bacterium]MDP4646409.1 alanine:cation symporter family protein [Akkermansiaceae bacterium]MDP4721514.1 alanine:cation symporter family protein [Akkermansiaceae bacterium]MDP4780012.1 alanine:cation symporter family protein [Akkermansiaceae bacterium]MDP4847062.1 alanine:cation symporter family protein [Akkermansiaceae bacterium]